MLAQINSSFVDGILCSSGGVDRMIQLQGIYLGAIELRTLNTHRFLFRLPKLLSRWWRQSRSRNYPFMNETQYSLWRHDTSPRDGEKYFRRRTLITKRYKASESLISLQEGC